MSITVEKAMQMLAQADPKALLVIQGLAPGAYQEVCAMAVTNQAFDAVNERLGFAQLTSDLERDGYTHEDVVAGVAAVAFY